jgi:type IV secretory pathway VirB4 component
MTAPNSDKLRDRRDRLRQVARAALADISPLTYQQRPAWDALQPGGRPLRWPWRLLDATSAAAAICLPVGPGPTVAAGTLAGVDPGSGVPISVDRFAAHNPTRLVVGTSGAGKSYAAKLELVRQLVAGTQVVVVDPEGEFGEAARVLGGLCLTVGEEPAGLDPVGLACRRSMSAAEGLSVLTAWSSALLGVRLGAVDLALLDRALSVLRADHLDAPTTGDLLSVIADIAAFPPFTGSDLPARLAPATGGALGHLFAPNPDLADPPDLVVFDLRAVPDRARSAVMACVLTWAWSQTVGSDANRDRLIVVDEAHLLLDDPDAAQLLVQFARRARKYGVGLDLVTQRLSDFLRDPAGEAVLANAATKLLLSCEDHERAAVAAGLGLTPAEAALLRPGTCGRGLLLTPDLRSPIQVVAAPAEHVLASSGPR